VLLDEVKYTDLLGKPFLLGGRGPDKYDCWGLCLELGRRVGIKLPEEFTPDETEMQSQFIHTYADKDFEKLDKPEPFCIVTFKIHPPFVDHCGFVLRDVHYFLHTMIGHNITKQRMDHKILAPKIEGFYRLKSENSQDQ